MQRKRGAPALIELLRGGTQSPPSLSVPPTGGGGGLGGGGRSGPVGVGPGAGMPPTAPLPGSHTGPSSGPASGPASGHSTGHAAGRPAPVAIEPKIVTGERPLAGPRPFADRLSKIPRPILYLVPAAVLVFLLGWTIAFQLGSRARELQDPRLTEAGTTPASGVNGPGRAELPPDPLSRPTGPTTPPTLPPTPPTMPPPVAPTAVTTLQPGVNYLVVANLFDPRGEHIPRCQQYLGQNGVNTVAMRAGEFSTNPRALNRADGWWVLVAVPGLPSDQFRANAATRQELEGRVQSLGRKWQAADRNVPTNFAAVFWAKHDPAKP